MKGGNDLAAWLRWAPLLMLIPLILIFGALSPRFLTPENLGGILVQSSWLIVVALGMNFVLLTGGVDLSVGSTMYLAAIAVGLGLPDAPVWVAIVAALGVGAVCGVVNATFVVRIGLPAFIVTLATLFIGRGIGLYLSSTKVVYASSAIADFGRASFLFIPAPVWVAGLALLASGVLLNRTALGPHVRSIGADAEGARRAGVPARPVAWSVYVLCGAFAGLAGFVSLSQTSAAAGSFGESAEFLAIASAVLGGTSLFGGRGSLWAPVVGTLVIMTVQNGLVMIDANPYVHPVITGSVILVAALFDSVRSRVQSRLERRAIRVASR